LPTDPLTASRYPAASAAPNVAQDIQNAVMDLSDNTIAGPFATDAARDAAYTAWVAAGGVMRNGLMCYVTAGDQFYKRAAGAWVPHPGLIPSALLTGTGTQAVGTGALSIVGLNVSSRASGMTVNTGSGSIAALRAGVYLVSGGVSFEANTTGRRLVQLFLNGVGIGQTSASSASGAGNWRVPTPTYQVALGVGDFLQVAGLQESGVTINFSKAESFLQATYVAAA
jgi:hypothetical protein